MIFLDTNVVSETLKKSANPNVIVWLVRHDAELALPTVTIAEVAYGIRKIRPDERAHRLEQGLTEWRQRFAGRIFAFTEAAVGAGISTVLFLGTLALTSRLEKTPSNARCFAQGSSLMC